MKSVFCLTDNEKQTQQIISRLLSSGFTNQDISVLSPNQKQFQGAQGNDFGSEGDKVMYKPWNQEGSSHTHDWTRESSWNKEGNACCQGGHESKWSGASSGSTMGSQGGNGGNEGGNQGSLSHENATKAPEGGVTGATTGGIIGGTLGLLAGLGTLAIPGLGAFVAAGPIIAALSGSAIGGSLGLLIGSLIGMGIPEYEAKKYESGLKSGKTLLSCRVNSDDAERTCKDIMESGGATDISSSSETAKSGY